MQHIHEKTSFVQHETEFYGPSSSSFHSQYAYAHETHSLSPQQSPTSDIEELSASTAYHHHHHRGESNNNKIIKKKKPSKKKRKDPNEPQKPVSPYALFFRDTQNDIKKKLSNPSFGEISKVVAHMWENIEPELKEQYKHRAAAAKKEYLKQLAAYRAVQVSHQTPTMSHILNQAALPFPPALHSHSSKSFHSPSEHASQQQQYSSSSSSSTSSSSHSQQYQHFHYQHQHQNNAHHAYGQESTMFYPDHTQSIYSSYDSNNNNPYPDHQHYGLIRPTGNEFEHYPSYYPPNSSYTDLSSTRYQHPLNENIPNQSFSPSNNNNNNCTSDLHWNSNSQW